MKHINSKTSGSTEVHGSLENKIDVGLQRSDRDQLVGKNPCV